MPLCKLQSLRPGRENSQSELILIVKGRPTTDKRKRIVFAVSSLEAKLLHIAYIPKDLNLKYE